MKLAALLSTMFVLCATAFAQKDVPEFGKIDKADLEMKQCSFDDAAEAVVLFDVAEVFCNFNSTLTTEFSRHVRIKILNDKGFNEANIKLRYYSLNNIEDITNISAHTINTDAAGNLVYTKVEKSLIYRKKFNKRYTDVIFTFPEVKKGSIIEYKYVDKASNLYGLKNWYFQDKIPVRFSRFTMDFPNELVMNASVKGGLQVERNEKQMGYRNVQTFTMKDVPALRNEPYISCDEDYKQQVVPILQAIDIAGQPRRNTIRTWPDIIKDAMEDEDFGVQLKRNLPRTADLDLLLANITDPYRKMVIIHDYVRRNMVWNEYYGIWALDGVRSAWKEKKGTSGEINLILVNLLKDADLDVKPLLVSTRDNGMVNLSVADFSQFNKVMAHVAIGKKTYVLDATNKFASVDIIPADVVYSEALLINKLSNAGWGWIVLTNPDKVFKNTVILMADIDSKGAMKGEATITSSDYARLDKMPSLSQGKSKFQQTYFDPKTTGCTVDSLWLDNEKVDSLPLNQHIAFTGKTSSSGDYHYFTPNLFTGLEKNPFIADDRFSDVFFGTTRKELFIERFTIPEGFAFDELPKNVRMIMPDTSIIFSRMMSAAGNELSVRISLEIKKEMYSVEEYPYFQEFYKKLFGMLNEQIVFKKK
ncbi:MAG: DUF3857 domain-containing protein [Ferruginibacter sp.]|nr:DUF3857 domain-containing protein [Ferruginibacter sp.]